MNPMTADDRRRELENLRARIRAHPERDWSEERHRIGALSTQITAQERMATA